MIILKRKNAAEFNWISMNIVQTEAFLKFIRKIVNPRLLSLFEQNINI